MGFARPGRDELVRRLLAEHGEIAELVLTCVACPVQYEGRLVDGRHLYFRFRHGEADLGLGADDDAAMFDPHAAVTRHGDDHSGVFDDDDTEARVFGELLRSRLALDAKVTDALARAGWSPARRVDSAPAVAALEEEGYRVSDGVREFLSTWSGLTILCDGQRLILDGAAAAGDANRYWCGCYSALRGVELVPVGWMSLMTILVEPCGSVFWGGVDDEYGWLGNSVEQLVEGQFTGRGGYRRTMLDRRVPDRGDGLGIPDDG